MIITFGDSRRVVGATAAGDFAVTLAEVGAVTAPDLTVSSSTLPDSVASVVIPEGGAVGSRIALENNTGSSVTLSAGESSLLCGADLIAVFGGDIEMSASGKTGVRKYRKTCPASTQTKRISYTPGSLAAHITSQILGLVAGKSPSSSTKDMFSAANYSYAALSATPNPSVFCTYTSAALSFTRDGTNWQYPIELISPLHCLCSSHASTWPGAVVVFRTTSGSFESRIIVSRVIVHGDATVVQLNAPITTITPFATLPADWQSYLPCLTYGTNHGTPMLARDGNDYQGARNQWEVRWCVAATSLDMPSGLAGGIWNENSFTNRRHISPSDIVDGWGGDVIGGDSGSPSFFPINGELVLVGGQGGDSIGPFFPALRELINTAMNTLAGTAQGTYVMRTVDLSGFTNFG
jgi:hypothetical protein